MVAVHAMLVSALAVGSVAFATPQRIIDSGLVVLVRTAGGGVGNGVVVGANEVATSCSVLAGAAAITVHETWKAPVARPAEGVPAILAARDEEGRACLLFLEEPFWRSPPVELASVSPSGSVAPGVRPNQPLFTVRVAEGYVLTVRTVFVGAPSNPVDREAAAAFASRADPQPAADRSATPLREAGTGVFDERGRLVAMTTLLPPESDRSAKGAAGGNEPPTRIWVPAREIAALLDSSAEWRACLVSPTPDCVLDEAAGTAIESGWGAEGVTAAWRDLGDRKQAEALLWESAVAALASGRHGPGNWLAFALVQFKAGDQAAALESIEEMKSEATREWNDAYWRIDFYARAAAALVKVGAEGPAADLAEEAVRLVNDRNGRDRTLSRAALVQANAGQVRAALRTAQTIADEQKRRYALGEMIRTLAEAGDIEGASWIAEQIPDSGYRAYVQQGIVAALAERGEVATALRIAGESRDQESRNHSLDSAARVFIRLGEFEAALEAGLLMDDTWLRVEALRWLARNQAEARDFRGALSTAEQLKSSRVPHRTGPTGYNTCGRKAYCGALHYVVGIMAEAGEVTMAFAAHERLDEPLDRLLVLGQVVGAGTAHGDPEVRAAVMELADGIVADDPKDLEALALVQAAVGDHTGAEATLHRIRASPWAYRGSSDEVDDPEFKALKTDRALARIARAEAGAGNFDDALRTANRVGSGFSRLYLLVDIAEAQAAAGEMRAARATFAEAVGLFERISSVRIRPCCAGTHPLVWAVEAVTHAQAKAGLGQQALDTLGRLELPEGRGFSLQKIVHAASSRGEFGLALRAQSVMSSWRTEALGYIARGLAGLPPGDLPHRID